MAVNPLPEMPLPRRRAVLAAVIALGALGAGELAASPRALAVTPTFTDVGEGTEHREHIAWLAASGITTGYPDGTFRPLGAVERGAMAAFLFRMGGAPRDYALLDYSDPKVRRLFLDVEAVSPFAREIQWLKGRAITFGYPDGTFRPNAAVSREAMAAFLHRTFHASFERAGVTVRPRSFADVPASAQFRTEIEWLAGLGITTGWADGTFRPQELIRRDAMAAFLHRMEDALATAGY